MVSSAISPIVVRYSRLGDLVMAIPAIRALSERYSSPVTVVTKAAWGNELFVGLPFVRDVVTVRSSHAPYWISPDQWALTRFFRLNRSRPVFLLEDSAKTRRLCRRAEANVVAARTRPAQLINEHNIDANARACHFGQGEYQRQPELAVSQGEVSACRGWLAAIGSTPSPIVVHPGSRDAQRGRTRSCRAWHIDRWLAVIADLRLRHPDTSVVITGTKPERAICANLASCAGTGVMSVAGETSLRSLMALLRLGRGCISVDTGPAHVAAAVGCPLVVLFGKTDPRINGPVAPKSRIRILTGPPGAAEPPGERAWAGTHSMLGITPEMVNEAWHSLNQERSNQEVPAF